MLSLADELSLLRDGVALGLKTRLFNQPLDTLPVGVAVAIEFSRPLAAAC